MLKILDQLEEIIIGTLIGMATLLIFTAVCHRYGLSHAINLANWGKVNGMDWLFHAGKSVFNFLKDINLTWAQEACIYMFVWMAKFGAAYGARTGIHVGVDVALNAMNSNSKYKIILFGLFCGALFTFIIGSLGADFVWHMASTGQVSADLEMPMWIVYLAVPLGSYLMCFRFLQVAYNFTRTGELPHHDHGHVEGLTDATSLTPDTTGEAGSSRNMAHGEVR